MKSLKILILLIFGIFLISNVSAVVVYGEWQNETNSIEITDGESINFNVNFFSMNPEMNINIKLYDQNNNYDLIKTFDVSSYDGGYSFQKAYLINENIYKNPGNFELVLMASDNFPSTQTHTLYLEVNPQTPQNHPPVLNTIGDKQVNENEQLQFSISATDADGDDLTYSASNLPPGAIFNSNTFVWTPTYTQSGIYHDVEFTVSDGIDSDSETVKITVNNVNRAPNIASIPDSTINEEDFYSYNVEASDPDEDDLTYSLTQNPNWLSINPNTGLITGTAPPVISDEEDQVTVKVSDGNEGSDTESYILTVNNLEGDTISPTITITYPINTTYTSHRTQLSYTVSDPNLDSCWYSLNGGQNVSTTCAQIITSIQSVNGTNIWKVYANDTSGNIGSASVTFIVEITEEPEPEPTDDKKGKISAYLYQDVDEIKYFKQFTKPATISYPEEIPEPEKETNWLILIIIIGIIALIIVIALILISRLKY